MNRNEEVERSIDEVIRLLENSPCGNAEGIELPDSTKSSFRQHHSLRMYQVMLSLLLLGLAKTMESGAPSPRRR